MPVAGSSYYNEFTLSNPTTGARQNADTLPVATASKNGVDDASFVLTVANVATGRYKVSGTIPATYAAGDTVTISVVATVATVTAVGVIDDFVLAGSLPVVVTPSPATMAPISAGLTSVYASDEHIAIRAGVDYINLTSQSQLLASASDGVFLAADPWTLTSASTLFDAQSVTPGCVVWLSKPQTAFPQLGQLLAVASVSGGSCTLRRLGMSSGQGSPVAPAAGVTGVTFSVHTYAPQIEEESYALNQLMNIDPTLPGRRPVDAADLRPLRRATVLRVLLDRWTVASAGGPGDYTVKIDQCRFELGEVMAALTIRWGNAPNDQASNRFSTRLVR